MQYFTDRFGVIAVLLEGLGQGYGIGRGIAEIRIQLPNRNTVGAHAGDERRA